MTAKIYIYKTSDDHDRRRQPRREEKKNLLVSLVAAGRFLVCFCLLSLASACLSVVETNRAVLETSATTAANDDGHGLY